MSIEMDIGQAGAYARFVLKEMEFKFTGTTVGVNVEGKDAQQSINSEARSLC
jgi:hypothetical protein